MLASKTSWSELGVPIEHTELLTAMLDKIITRGYIVLTVFKYGAHLYGTETPSSDTDYRILFFPSFSDVVSNNVTASFRFSTGEKHQKDTSSDVDIQAVDIRDIIKRFVKGEIVAIDSIYAITNPSAVLFLNSNYHEWWVRWIEDQLLSPQTLDGVLGYMNRQVNRYGLRGTRLGDLLTITEAIKPYLETGEKPLTLGQWLQNSRREEKSAFNRLEPTTIIQNASGGKRVEKEAVSLFGRKFVLSTPLPVFAAAVDHMIEKYGNRSKAALESGRVDWKAFSHAYRAAVEYILLYTTGKVKFPLEEHDKKNILAIKSGSLEFEVVAKMVEEKMEKISRQDPLSKHRVDFTIANAAITNLASIIWFGGEVHDES